MPDSSASSPTEIVTATIIERLTAEHLIQADAAPGVRTKMLAGKMSAQDWRRLLETAVTPKGAANASQT